MDKSKIFKIVHIFYDWTFTALTVFVGALFVIQTLDLYLKGTAPGAIGDIFTPDKIASQISEIALYIFIWLFFLLLGIVYNLFIKKPNGLLDKDDYKKRRSDFEYLRLSKKIDDQAKGNQEYEFIDKQNRIIKILKIIALAVALSASVYAIIYLATPSNFTKENVNGEIVALVANVFPFYALVFVLFIGISYFEKQSRIKQLPYLKSITKSIKTKKENEENISLILIARISVAVVAIAFVIWGICNEGMREVFEKAINICTECIGLG